jgi:hypothetical protein
MNEQQLADLGFQFVAGNIDRDGKCYGTLTSTGPELNDAGKQLIADAVAGRIDKPVESPVKHRKVIARGVGTVTSGPPAEAPTTDE